MPHSDTLRNFIDAIEHNLIDGSSTVDVQDKGEGRFDVSVSGTFIGSFIDNEVANGTTQIAVYAFEPEGTQDRRSIFLGWVTTPDEAADLLMSRT